MTRMHFEVNLDVNASPKALWDALVDIESWPALTPSINRLERLDDGPLAKGSRTRVYQPKLRPAIWTITEFTPSTSFVWEATAPGVKTVGGHYMTPNADDTASLRLTLDQTGPLAPLIALLAGRRAKLYVTQEAHALKQQAESL
ncbi:SRPBCC family protein [Spirillospora sp. CA-294931]|uniref:SRPBCC family protein n=1 Tax=Spirillospora sp. CA-294931 TaxID=3240042 RepID=UPI003D89BA82